jgi:hypothetical protein
MRLLGLDVRVARWMPGTIRRTNESTLTIRANSYATHLTVTAACLMAVQRISSVKAIVGLRPSFSAHVRHGTPGQVGRTRGTRPVPDSSVTGLSENVEIWGTHGPQRGKIPLQGVSYTGDK